MRRSRLLLVGFGALCGAGPAAAAAGEPPELAAGRPPLFTDRAEEWGLDFVHFNGMVGKFYFPEMTGQGGALLDYDHDGDLDVYLVEGGLLGPEDRLEDAVFPYRSDGPPRDRLFRNDLGVASAGDGPTPRFVDVTDAAGLAATGYGMGVATGDYDGDGWTDLYLTNYGPNQLWRNRGDGTFEDATAVAGVGDPLWGTSATFLDYDRDGRLDLYVVNYVEFDVVRNPACLASSSRRDYCGPADFPPQPDRLYHNRGDGTFEEVSPRALPGYVPGPGLGVVAADLDGNGWLDLYVANDGAANQLWLNRGDGTFRDEALLAGVAVNRAGRPEASMGVDAGDYDGDGDEDLFLTHLMGETNTLYANLGGALFEDRTIESGLGPGSLPYTSFGTAWIDYDNDGRLDLLILNGAVRILEPQAAAGDPYPLHQPNQLFRNRGDRSFEEVTAAAGPAFELSEVSRGAAFGDVDQDGDLDVLVLNNAGRARLLVNETGQDASWLGAAPAPGATLLGASMTVRAGPRAVYRRFHTDGSYCSARDPRVVAGLGAATAVDALTLHRPAAPAQAWLRPPVARYIVLVP